MTPKEIVRAAFEKIVTPVLEERGFSYLPSRLSYKRKVGDFGQLIAVTLSHRNSIQDISFSSWFTVGSPRYQAWRKERLLDPVDGSFIGIAEWNIPGWRSAGDHSCGMHASDPAQVPDAAREWLSRFVAAGSPYLDQLSSWEGLGHELVRQQWRGGGPPTFSKLAAAQGTRL